MNSIIIGANSVIAQGIIKQITPKSESIIAISSQPFSNIQDTIQTILCNYSSDSISHVVNKIKRLNLTSIDRVYICNGVLHNETIKVEKRIEDINPEAFMALMNSNALTPILWVKALLPLLRHQQCTVTVLSARVGSINDNHLGGWYSYRASKAALNMLLKSASIEYAKRAKGVKILAFHPGTTNTPLSEPFQKNIPEDKLFTPKFVALQLEKIICRLKTDGQLSFLDWQGQDISW
jgi:NAD(P)-dependent dehydrogenase (short-subunit alcohol dehydrogenase family)